LEPLVKSFENGTKVNFRSDFSNSLILDCELQMILHLKASVAKYLFHGFLRMPYRMKFLLIMPLNFCKIIHT
jgi:hypothetical protein